MRKTYAQWSEMLDRFEQGRDDMLDEMEKADFHLGAGTAGRFLTMINRVYQSRKQKWMDEMTQTMEHTRMRSMNEWDILFRQWKAKLVPLQRLIRLPVLPPEVKEQFEKDLSQTLEEIKKSLETSVQAHYPDKQKFLFFLRNFSLYQWDEPSHKSGSTGTQKDEPPKGRRIIF